MLDFMSFFTKKEPSKNIATDRLKLVHVHDRVNCSPQILEMMKNDILKVISNYAELDDEGIDIQITQTPTGENGETMPTLYANIPLKGMRKNYS